MPRSEKQFAHLRERSRAKILRAAIDLFAKQGFHPTTVADIARIAGVATGLIYNYFETKEALLAEILRDAQQELATLVDQQLRQTPEGDIRVFMSGLLSRVKNKLPVWRMIMSVTLQNSAKRFSQKAPRGFDKLLIRVTGAGMKAPDGQYHWNALQTAEVLHAILVAYCVTGNEAAARRQIELLGAQLGRRATYCGSDLKLRKESRGRGNHHDSISD